VRLLDLATWAAAGVLVVAALAIVVGVLRDARRLLRLLGSSGDPPPE
jgi:hypothetical protein